MNFKTYTEDGSEGGRMIYCDRCDDAFHIGCLQPPLASVPKANESWFCARYAICLVIRCMLRLSQWGSTGVLGRCVSCVSCKVDKKGGDHSSVWSYKLDMCIACHEVENQVVEVMNHLLSCCEKRVEARTEDSSVLYWAEETDSPDASTTAAVQSTMPEKKEEPPVNQESQQEAPDISGLMLEQFPCYMFYFNWQVPLYLCTEPASIKRARLKKLKLDKALEDVLSNVIQSSEDAEKEAKRSQIIAEFEVVSHYLLSYFVVTIEVGVVLNNSYFRLQTLNIRES